MSREEKGSSMGSYDDMPPGNQPGEEATSLAARRARLRGSLGKGARPKETFEAEPEAAAAPAPELEPDAVAAALSPIEFASENQPAFLPAPVQNVNQNLPAVPPAVMELLTSIDQAMNACALNLAALQKLSGEQSEVLKVLSDTLKNQTLYEIGLNLNSLTESMSAALEPMKAAGELVPAIDQLVAAMESRAAADAKYSPDVLVMNLADQLSSGALDPWTFKCAYMAIFPDDHPADLLRRLVELLGTQRLSGDLFRSAYEAVQAAEPPNRQAATPKRQRAAASQSSDDAGAGNENVPAAAPTQSVLADDPETKAQLEALRSANEELSKAMDEREREFEQLLAVKDQELQEAQDMLNARYEEFNTRYAELTESLNKREEEYKALLENKDMELSEKETELGMLRHQMEELRSQTEEMVGELQKQMADVRTAKEAASASSSPPNKAQPASGFFDAVQPQSKPAVFEAPSEPAAPAPPEPAVEPAPPAQTQSPPAPPAPAASQSVSQLVSRPQAGAGAPFASGAGSYGSGVRAQVFEVIVRQALAGAPWREICAGPMQVNNISPEEVEAEVKRRQSMLK